MCLNKLVCFTPFAKVLQIYVFFFILTNLFRVIRYFLLYDGLNYVSFDSFQSLGVFILNGYAFGKCCIYDRLS